MKGVHFIIFAKDVQLITGLSLRQGERILEKIKKQLGRKKDQFVTLSEFCSFYQFKEDEVIKVLNNATQKPI